VTGRRLGTALPALAFAAWALPASSAIALRCLEAVPGVTWMRWTASGEDALDRWCASVGPPVFLASAVMPGEITRLRILSWNIHVGGGRVEDIVRSIRDDISDTSRTGVVLLLEEAYRAGQDVPDSYPPGLRVPSAIRPWRRGVDIVELASRLKMSVAYVPSMRNGPATSVSEREDRGNAVLSTEPLSDVRAIELPLGKQRRVAIAVTVTPRRPSAMPLRVIATHFDTSGERVPQARALGQRIVELRGLPMVVGGDFNAFRGFRDDAVRAVGDHISLEGCGTGRTNRWPLRLDVLAFFIGRLDFMFSTLGSLGIVRECRTLTDAYGSDHLPVLLTVRY